MNKTLYRVVFNCKRGAMVAVAETTKREGKSCADSDSGSVHVPSVSSSPTHSKAFSFSFSLLGFCLCLALGTVNIAFADGIIADKHAPQTQQATILQTGNGTPQVNIQTPTSAGVSVNQYVQFDVGNRGAILNNSRSNTQTQLGGWIQGNPWLARGEARVIVNQVNSAHPSQLNGYIEVGGRRAEVVVANPAGIAVNGGGFIHASGATLTTGAPQYQAGALTGFQVRSGHIAITGQGLDARDADYTRILNQATQIDAPVWGQDIRVIAGQNDVAATGNAHSPIPNNAAAHTSNNTANNGTHIPLFAIDTSTLGGMYANKITLISTAEQAGIRNQGQLFASAGNVVLEANGQLINSGTIAATNAQDTNNTAEHKIHIHSQAVENSGTMASQQSTHIQTQSIQNTGTLLSSGELLIHNSGSLKNNTSGTIEAARLAIDTDTLNNQGKLSQTGSQKLHIEATGAFNNSGKIGLPENTANHNTSNGGRGNRPTQPNTPSSATGSGSTHIQVHTDHAGNTVTSTQLAEGMIQTKGAFNHSGSLNANGDLDLTAKSGLTNTAELNVNRLVVSGEVLGNTNAKIIAQTTAIHTDTVYNQQGEFTAAEQLNITTNQLDNRAGKLKSVNDADLAVSGSLNNQGGEIAANHALNIHDNQAKTLRIDNTDGKIVANDVLLQSQSLDNRGKLAAGHDLSIDLKDDFTVERNLEAGNKLSIKTSGNLNNAQIIQAESEVNIQAKQDITNRGLMNSNGLTRVQASQQLLNIGTGKIYGNHVALAGDSVVNREENGKAAVVAARERLDIGAREILNQEHSLLFSAGDLAIGRHLNEHHQADGVSDRIHNLSATIEALGNGRISSKDTLNRNEHFSLKHKVEVGTPEHFHEMSPEGQPNRRIDWNLLKEVHFSRAGKWVFKDDKEISIDKIELGKTPIPDVFELDAVTGQIRKEALYLPDAAAWAYFGIAAPKTMPPTIPQNIVEPTLPNGMKEEDCTQNPSLCTQYLADKEAYEKAIAPYTAWLDANQSAYKQLDGAINRYNQGKRGEEFKDFTLYRYTRRHYQDQVATSDPSKIITGGDLLLDGGKVINDKSQIVAGKTMLSGLDNIENIDADAFKYIEDTGTSQYTKSRWRGGFKRYHQRDWDNPQPYRPVPPPTPISLPVAEKKEHTSLTTQHHIPTSAQADAVKSVTPNPNHLANLPTSSLFITHAHRDDYLIETHPQFTNYRRWLGSDYMLNALKQDPNHLHKRLGDGYYEQNLLRDQIISLTGQRFLDGYHNDEAQFKALMDNGLTFAKTQALSVGIALSAEQVARLSSDIVWLEYQTITLADGSTQQVLVPKVYVVPRSGDLKDSGALIAANHMQLDVSGNLKNSGSLNARNIMILNAENVAMLGQAQGKQIGISAKQDINIIGGTVSAQEKLNVHANKDVKIASTTVSANHTEPHFNSSRTDIGRIAGLYVTDANGSLNISADDIHLAAAVINNQGSGNTVLAANRTLNIGTVQTAHKNSTRADSKNYLIEGQSQEIGSQIHGQGHVVLVSQDKTHIRGSQINSENGTLAVNANGLTISVGQSSSEFAESHDHKHGSIGGSSSRVRRYEFIGTEATSSSLTGKKVILQSSGDMHISGSQVISDEQTHLNAKGDIRIDAAGNQQTAITYAQNSRSGVMGTGGIGFAIGSKKTTDDRDSTSLTHTSSTVGSIKGDTTIIAGKHYQQIGSTVSSPEGNNTIHAQSIDIQAAHNQLNSNTTQTYEQKGLTVAFSSPVTDLGQQAIAVAQSSKKVRQSKNDRVNAMAAVNAGWQAYQTGKGAENLANKTGNAKQVSIAITYGEQKNQQATQIQASQAQASQIQAGGKTTLIATGAAEQSNINITGSDVAGKAGTILIADNDITLQSAEQSSSERSNNKSSGWNAGVAVSFGQGGWSLGFTAGGNVGKGYGNGDSLTHRHSHIGDKGSQTLIQSGGDTTLKGAQVMGKGVQVDAQNLTIQSVQESESYRSKQQNASAQVTVGYGFSASGHYSQSKIHAEHQSISEQSGIYAGDEGYKINIAQHTDLKGGIITSTQSAEDKGKNRFSTGTLTTSDIKNHSRYEGKSFGIGTDGNVKGGWTGKAKDGLSASLGYGNDGDKQSSVTRSGINTQNIRITDEDKQIQLTGKTAEETKAQIHTDTTTETAQELSGSLHNVFDKEAVQSELDLQRAVSQDFSQTSQQAGTEINRKAKEYDDKAEQLAQAAAKADAEGNQELAQALAVQAGDERKKAASWQRGGVLLNMISAGLSAPTQSTTGIVAATASPALSYEIGQQFKKHNAEGTPAHILAHAILGAAVAAAGDNNALAGALSAGGSEAAAPYISKWLYGKDKGSDLTAEEKETVTVITSLLGTATGAAVGNSATDAAQGSLNVQSAVENNFSLQDVKDNWNRLTGGLLGVAASFGSAGEPILHPIDTWNGLKEFANADDKLAVLQMGLILTVEERNQDYETFVRLNDEFGKSMVIGRSVTDITSAVTMISKTPALFKTALAQLRKTGYATINGVKVVYVSGKIARAADNYVAPIQVHKPTIGIYQTAKKLPQGISYEKFSNLSQKLRTRVGNISSDILIQGSRAKGTAKPNSDLDIAIRVTPEDFNDLISKYFGKPNAGSAKERTMLHAIQTGKIQSGEAKLSSFRKELEKDLGMDVDISIIKQGGKFDNPPYIKVQ